MVDRQVHLISKYLSIAMKILSRLGLLAGIGLCLTALSVSAQDADYNRYYNNLPVEVRAAKTPVIPPRTVRLEDFGGVGDGITLNTEAFAKAIKHLSELGGGHLVVGDGVWLTGPITMKSNIDLHVERNALVVFSPDRNLYPVLPPDEGTISKLVTAPINASHESNFSITGEGVFDGNGEVWRPVKKMKFGEWEWKKFVNSGGTLSADGSIWYPTTANEEQGQKRPRLLRLVGCDRILLQGVTFQNSPSFHVNMFLCTDIVIDGINVRCPWNAQNGDGIDLSSCRRALIVNSAVDCGDDALCLKSGVGEPGRKRGQTSDVLIENCTVFHGHGGFVIGSDEAGGMDRLLVRHCRFIDTDTGLRFKSGRDRGGVVENVYVEDVVMNDIDGEAILFDMYYQEKPKLTGDVEPRPVTVDTPVFRNFHIKNVVCREAGRAILFQGLPEMPLSDVTIEDCTINARHGVQINETDRLTISNLRLEVAEGPTVGINNSRNITINNLMVVGEPLTTSVTGSRNGKLTLNGAKL